MTDPAVQDREITFSVKKYPVLRSFLNDNSKFISAIMGPFGSAKSSTCLMKIIKLARLQKPGPDGIRRVRWAVIRNTYPMLSDTTMKTVFSWLPAEDFGLFNKVEHNYFIDEIPGIYIELMFRALDRPDHVKNLLSMELTGAWINEYREVAKEIFEALQGRVGRYPAERDGGCTWYGILMDSNPPEEGAYYHKLFEDVQPDNARLWKQPSGLSPEAENVDHLPVNYYSNLAKGKTKDFITVYIEGKYGSTHEGEPVVPEYREETHRAKESLPIMPKARGVRFYDGGLCPTCIIGQISPSGRLFIKKTFRGENIGMKQLLTAHVMPYLHTEFKGVKAWLDVGDPSLLNREQSNSDNCAAKVIEDLLKTSFIPGVVRWEPRRDTLKAAMNEMRDGQAWFQIDPADVILHKALSGGWHYEIANDGKAIKDIPLKDKHSHPGDALSYGVTELLGVRTYDPRYEDEEDVIIQPMSKVMGF
jgi:hypothetical protein